MLVTHAQSEPTEQAMLPLLYGNAQNAYKASTLRLLQQTPYCIASPVHQARTPAFWLPLHASPVLQARTPSHPAQVLRPSVCSVLKANIQ